MTDKAAPVSETPDRHTPRSLADVLERDYFPMPDGAKLYLSEYEWRMVIDALRAAERRAERARDEAFEEAVDALMPANHPLIVAAINVIRALAQKEKK